MKFFALLLTLCLSTFAVEAQITPKTTWPRLGGIKIGDPHDYDNPATQAALAKLDYVVISFTPSWGTPAKMQAAVQAIKALHPNILIVDYTIQETIHNTFPGLVAFRAKLDAERWWLYRNGTTGTRATHDPAATTTNFTNAVPRDANGDRWNTWFAKRVYTDRWSKVPGLDGTFTDNVFWKPRASGDWDRNGTLNSEKDTSIYPLFRRGMVTHLSTLRAVMPGKLVVGNIGDWGRPEASTPEYDKQLDGGLLEQYIGNTWSNEGVDMNGVFNGWGSWSRMMTAYHKVSARVNNPGLIIFGMKGKPTDYKTFRYGFASALMGDGHFDFSDGTSGSVYKPSVVWFDEYDLAGTATTGWLGKAVDPVQTSPWERGVYRRRFEHGMVLVNPRGNGPQTVAIGPGYRRFAGKQAPMINDGMPVTSVTIPDRDGLILVGDIPMVCTPAP